VKQSPPSGPVMFDLRDLSLTGEETEKLRHPAAGGIILFSRNYQSPPQLTALIASIRAVRPELLIAVDHEGGRVQRFREGFTHLPPAAAYAQVHKREPERLMKLLEAAGWLMAAELRAVDVDFSFAPVLDVDCGISQIIGDRSFSQDPEEACRFALAFMKGMHRAGMAAVGKHFPGHGGVAQDSHLTLPSDARSYGQIARRDLVPFKSLIEQGLEGIMPAHVVYPAVDDKPASFSSRWVEDVLRKELGFRGAVFSDDLSMQGATFAGSYADRTRLALEAGCDMVLVCNQPEAIDAVLEASLDADMTIRRNRLERMRGRFAIDRNALLASAQWHAAAEEIRHLNDHRITA
jgi:beta-N-acetylhexosaminidase